jgi:hypothetical protein
MGYNDEPSCERVVEACSTMGYLDCCLRSLRKRRERMRVGKGLR